MSKSISGKVSFFMITSLMILFTGIVTAQNKDEEKEKNVKIKPVPIQAQYTDRFDIQNIYFNKRIDLKGVGEILEVELILRSHLDDPQELNIFVIASYEKKHRKETSFLHPIPPQKKIKSFVPYPDDIKNFQYPYTDRNGKVRKDEKGMDRLMFVKNPVDPKKGINPETGKPYLLKDKLVLRTRHLSKYRYDYFFFNEVAVLIYDKDGKPLFRQLYELKGFRR